MRHIDAELAKEAMDKCGAIFSGGKYKILGMWNFCPNCGADMIEEGEC